MAKQSERHMKLVTTVLLVSAHLTASNTVKYNPRPVHEVAIEQASTEDKYKNPSSLIYGNPLAGNSPKNARLHAENQQAMFNAERMRQHKAQLDRWTKAPIKIDSYMKAFQESQESHQLAVEKQQTRLRDLNLRAISTRQKVKPETLKITEEDAIVQTGRSRNHRSHGSIDYQPYIQPKKYHSVYLAAGPTFDEGVTIKPNGIADLTNYKNPMDESRKLYTEAIPSKLENVYPSKFSALNNYQPTKDIDSLNSILGKSPNEQVSELNALLTSSNDQQLNTPIDLFFYVNQQGEPLPQHYAPTEHAQIPYNYASAYMPEVVYEDHKPITEEIDDVEDPNKDKRLYTPVTQTVFVTPQQQELETTTTKTNNYYKVEVASQTITSGYKPSKIKQENQGYQYLQSEEPATFFLQHNTNIDDSSERHLHQKGIKYLNHDGTSVSAYSDENVSICRVQIGCKNVVKTNKLKINSHFKGRQRRSSLDTDSSDNIKSSTESNASDTNNSNDTDLPKAEPLTRLLFANNKRVTDTFLTTPNFQIGEAMDFNNDYDGLYDDDEYSDYNDELDPDDYDYEPEISPLLTNRPSHHYAHTTFNHNTDLDISSSRRYRKHRPYRQRNHGYSQWNSLPQSYAPPPVAYGVPAPAYMPSSYNKVPIMSTVEPVYILTQSQVKDLMGHHNLNIQNLDVFQMPKNKRPHHYPRHKHRHRESSYDRYRKLQYAANYEFGYRVRDHHTGNDFGHHEEKEDGKTNGHYHVLLPDGRLQNVKYTAGPEGFHADITYGHLQDPL